jgi:hypothetical protein
MTSGRVPEIRDVAVELHIVGVLGAQEAEQGIRAVGGKHISRRATGPSPVPPADYVIGALIPAGELAELIRGIRMRHWCRQIIDGRRTVMVFFEDCTQRDGSILVVPRRGVAVEINGAPKDTDMSEIAEALLAGNGKDIVPRPQPPALGQPSTHRPVEPPWVRTSRDQVSDTGSLGPSSSACLRGHSPTGVSDFSWTCRGKTMSTST